MNCIFTRVLKGLLPIKPGRFRYGPRLRFSCGHACLAMHYLVLPRFLTLLKGLLGICLILFFGFSSESRTNYHGNIFLTYSRTLTPEPGVD